MEDARDLSNTTSDCSDTPDCSNTPDSSDLPDCSNIPDGLRPWRRLFPLLCLLLLAHSSVASAQTVATPTPSNPAPTSCGLPAAGTVLSSVTYSLTANCTLTARLHFNNPAGTYTINGTATVSGPQKTSTGHYWNLVQAAPLP